MAEPRGLKPVREPFKCAPAAQLPAHGPVIHNVVTVGRPPCCLQYGRRMEVADTQFREVGNGRCSLVEAKRSAELNAVAAAETDPALLPFGLVHHPALGMWRDERRGAPILRHASEPVVLVCDVALLRTDKSMRPRPISAPRCCRQ